jgi:hypothetical protein
MELHLLLTKYSFMDEVDAIGGSRFSEGTSADREIQRTLMELLAQLDGFEALGAVKIVMATNRPGVFYRLCLPRFYPQLLLHVTKIFWIQLSCGQEGCITFKLFCL